MSVKNTTLITKEYLITEYVENGKSVPELAEMNSTYANNILRQLKKHGIPRRSRSESQAAALKSGRAEHPTSGKELSEETREKISEGIAKVWEDMSEEERKKRSEQGTENWNKKTLAERRDFNKKGTDACRVAAKKGSKIELYLFEKFIADGWKVQFHKEQFLQNARLQIDLYFPEVKVCLELDGPSHDSAVWGVKSLNRNLRADNQKSGSILAAGLVMLRVKCRPRVSEKYCRDTYAILKEKLDEIKANFPPPGSRLIELDLSE